VGTSAEVVTTTTYDANNNVLTLTLRNNGTGGAQTTTYTFDVSVLPSPSSQGSHKCRSFAAMTTMLTTTEVPTQVIKTDSLGRLRVTAQRREDLLDEFERSGLSGQKFAEVLGLKYQTFATWVQKRRRQRGAATADSEKASDSTRWLEAMVEQAHGSASVVLLHLPGGVRLEMGDVKQAEVVAALLRALAKPC
jgi:DNA-binding transcriptional regulator YiaG